MNRGEGGGKKGERSIIDIYILVILYLEYALDRFPTLPFSLTLEG